jgi:exodeoxyribonuclease VII large subunit
MAPRRSRPAAAPTAATTPSLWDDPGDPTWSVPELGQAIGLSLRAAFPGEVWVRGVIRNLNPSRRGGTVWFDLIEPAPGGDLAKPAQATLPVVLFNQERLRVNARLRDAGGGVRMSDGTEVRLRGRVTFYDRGGRVQLQMSDIDPAFTLGRLAADRERLLRALDAEGLLTRQAGLPRPVVPLRLGLVTSAGSAAEHDVLDELRRSGIGFSVVRADVRVQGSHAARSVAWGLAAVAARGVDAVLLVRGGGATTDLAAFDSEIIARAVAGLDVPVLTGIGHDIDRSVADDVAHASYKTPTACAQAVVDDVRAFERHAFDVWRGVAAAVGRHLRAEGDRLRTCGRHVAVATRQGLSGADRDLSGRAMRVRRSATGALARSALALERSVGRAESGARARLRGHEQVVAAAAERLVQRPPRLLAGASRDLARLDAQVRALDPARSLARGWSITRHADGRVVRSVRDVAAGHELSTTLADGEVRSSVSDPTEGVRTP